MGPVNFYIYLNTIYFNVGTQWGVNGVTAGGGSYEGVAR
jgi:hypothetical protein